MRHVRLVRIMCCIMLAGASLGAAAQPPSSSRFFHGWFAQGAERPGGRGDRQGGAQPGSARPQQPQPQPQEVRPQGDLRGDIYNHLREQRRAPASPPASDPRQRDRGAHTR